MGGVLPVFRWRVPAVEVTSVPSKVPHPQMVTSEPIMNATKCRPLLWLPFGEKRPTFALAFTD